MAQYDVHQAWAWFDAESIFDKYHYLWPLPDEIVLTSSAHNSGGDYFHRANLDGFLDSE